MIKLRKVRKTDYRFVYDLIKDFLDSGLSVSFLELPTFNRFCKNYFKNKKLYIIIYGNKRCGTVNINNDEIGYMLLPEFRGKGIAINAVKELMKMHPRKRYFATINNHNKRSINLIRKLGFKPKGTIYEKIE
ncbi:MAG: GNAT family N-acetyltransferase [Candidatus Nitrosotenuis sp.]